MNDYRQAPLWQSAFAEQNDGLQDQRTKLVTAYAEFRERVSLLVGQIHKDMPDLTVHDISHIDALWWIASEIAGEGYPLNPAEAFVLGGAFLLHDAAHCRAAYPGGIDEIRALPEWREFAAGKGDLEPGTPAFQMVLFDVLRTLHPKQARKLAGLSWQAPADPSPLFLLPHDELRLAYADAIGRLAESHWWSPHELETFSQQRLTAPACLHPATWDVDLLKLAVLLRTADAAHLDAQRSPLFLLALTKPGGSSLAHWQFQNRMHRVQRDPDRAREDLRLSAAPFPVTEQEAWWLALDAARLIDKELRAADRLLLEHRRPRLAARHLSAANSPEDFARDVPTVGWQPVDASIHISDVQSLVDRFGGEKLYGNEPWKALRELLQNAIDAIHACRALGGLGPEEGEIEVAVDDVEGGHWLHVTDTGIGMSRYVLTEVLLDFGRSLWRSPDLRGEWNGLKATGFEAIGQFGIGFFAVFMLGQHVKVTTRRYETKEGECSQWLLEFPAGTSKRPVLRVPDAGERLRRHGTKVSVFVTEEKFAVLGPSLNQWDTNAPHMELTKLCAWLAPASDVHVFVRDTDGSRLRVVQANDWHTLDALELLRRLAPGGISESTGTQFGPWAHLSPMQAGDGSIVGRCAATHTNLLYVSGELGVGVIKGLRAGGVAGLAGIVRVREQADLARNSAVPDLSLADIQRWANIQAEILRSRASQDHDDEDVLDFLDDVRSVALIDLSGILAAYGAEHTDLVIGDLFDEPVTEARLALALAKLNRMVIHEGQIDHSDEDDEDGVSKTVFRSNFEPSKSTLELTVVRAPMWLDRLDTSPGVSREKWSVWVAMERAVKQAWGEVLWSDEWSEVGNVNAHSILRKCRVARRKSP